MIIWHVSLRNCLPGLVLDSCDSPVGSFGRDHIVPLSTPRTQGHNLTYLLNYLASSWQKRAQDISRIDCTVTLSLE